MHMTTRPISDRTGFTGKHEASKFGVKYAQALELLDRELTMIKARDIVVEVDVPESAIRLDGGLRADARAASPGVRLAFDSMHGPLVYATDRFVRGDAYVWIGAYDSGRRRKQETMRQDWQHNLYALAKSLEAARLMDRYGATARGEQYAGFKQLGAGRAMPASHMTSDQAWGVLAEVTGFGITAAEATDADELRSYFREARRATHPDRRDGDRSLWDKVEEAGKLLGLVSS